MNGQTVMAHIGIIDKTTFHHPPPNNPLQSTQAEEYKQFRE